MERNEEGKSKFCKASFVILYIKLNFIWFASLSGLMLIIYGLQDGYVSNPIFLLLSK